MIPTRQRWQTELARRIRFVFWLKFAGTTLWTWLFFVGYFELLRHPAHAPLVMPVTALDRWLPSEPWALPIYLSLWIYVGIAPGLQRSVRELFAYGGWAGALLLAGLAFFRLWPTAVDPVAFDSASVPGFDLLQGIDAAGNACPSMHVAIATFTGLWVERLMRDVGAPPPTRLANAAWCLAIVWSTLATRQHVALDAAAGALLGGAFAWPSIALRPRPSGPRSPADIIDRTPVDIAP